EGAEAAADGGASGAGGGERGRVPAIGRHLGDGVPAGAQQPPEAVGTDDAAGKTAADADHGERLVLGRRHPQQAAEQLALVWRQPGDALGGGHGAPASSSGSCSSSANSAATSSRSAATPRS